jgi:hypothetical protein
VRTNKGRLNVFYLNRKPEFIVFDKLQLYAFLFDETFKSLQGQGSVITLAPWYSQAEVSILQLSFVCGNDEVALVDSAAQVRIFSFITLQFRWVFIVLLRSSSSPITDASC